MKQVSRDLSTPTRGVRIHASWNGVTSSAVDEKLPMVETYHCCKFTGWVERGGGSMPAYWTTITRHRSNWASVSISSGCGPVRWVWPELMYDPGPNVPYVSYVMQ